MRGLTLWEPWATLMAIEAKRYETRSWSTPYRGPVAIHASSTWRQEALLYFQSCRPAQAAFRRHGLKLDRLPLGCIIAFADLVSIETTDAVRMRLSVDELAFGDYSPRRFAWKFENVRRLEQPIKIRGRQGLWEYRHEVEV